MRLEIRDGKEIDEDEGSNPLGLVKKLIFEITAKPIKINIQMGPLGGSGGMCKAESCTKSMEYNYLIHWYVKLRSFITV